MIKAREHLPAISSAILLLLCSISNVSAQSENVVVGFTDHSLLEGFSESEIVDRELLEDINYRIVLGGLERVRGEVIPEASERVRGDVTKITYEVSQEFNGGDVYQFFQEQLSGKNYQILFSCEGRACGSSNYWANDIFRNRILYGPESNQYFMAFRTESSADTDPYLSLYIITRVNRTIYAYLEVVEPAGTNEPRQVAAAVEPPPEVVEIVPDVNLSQQLRDRGSAVLPDLEFQSNDRLAASAEIESVLSVFTSDASVSVYLVGHLELEGQPLEVMMRRSAARANSLRQALIARGVEGSRIEAAGVGPLAPNCAGQNCENRIEMVLR